MLVVVVLLFAMFVAIAFVVLVVARAGKASNGKPLTALAGTLGVPAASPLVAERFGREFTMQIFHALTVWANRALDGSPATPHASVITEKWTTKPKSTTYYHLRVRSWRPGEDTIPLSVSRSFSTSAAVGQGIVVNTHRGWLGWEWVDTFRLVKPPA